MWDEEHLPDQLKSCAANAPTDNASAADKLPRFVRCRDFVAYSPQHDYIYIPSRQHWPASIINERLRPRPLLNANGKVKRDAKGKRILIAASKWISKYNPVDQMTWAPGEPEMIRGGIIRNGGWTKQIGASCFNEYQPPIIVHGDPADVQPWLDLITKLYPDAVDDILNWSAQRVQRL
ncbi:hypothetical protein A5906_26325 [Bradyrhizobium sacchari]|uniref:Uncharacterized protein n=1 Tax=Bradyrhizobium sacchari TaxID=1399419 RepID=A0A560K2U9_9BRAD|nr:hypothetical protein [Bradyrhizobium sacchari]OPY99246.1 hypothetical protein A5906_26325 [Bradyrhizobium sacchari]TWB62946.1 hypothetical protein FBZ94_103646 [Bradyrhizobium sacchari]TWB76124.1 hypothetical protein FBZ95_104304 [Bradyrhizobium sacchari]